MKGHFAEAERLYVDQNNSLMGTIVDIKKAIETGSSMFNKDERWKDELALGLQFANQAQGLSNAIEQDFATEAQWIKDKDLSIEIQQRQAQSFSDYNNRYGEFVEKLTPLQSTQDEDEQIAALKVLNEYLADQQFGRKHQEYDGETMGNSSPNSAADKPLMLNKADYFQAGLESNPAVQVAALGDFTYDNLPNADDPAFLAETDEVVISQVIKDQAEALDYAPSGRF